MGLVPAAKPEKGKSKTPASADLLKPIAKMDSDVVTPAGMPLFLLSRWPRERDGSAPSVQTKLVASQAGDENEQEADHVADEVMRMPESRANDRESLQTHSAAPGQLGQTGVPPAVHEVLRSPGKPLDASTRAYVEPRFGYDFSNVRVHTDESAERSAHALNAAAFTVGADIAFARSCYAPASAGGRALLAHELAHVVQQANGPRVLARQTLERYETIGKPLLAELDELAEVGYWEQKIRPLFKLNVDPRLQTNSEEKEAVLAVVFQMLPRTAVSQDMTNVVKIPKRAAAGASQDLTYQITFKPREVKTDRDIVEIRFIAEGAGATPVVPDPPSTSFTPKPIQYSTNSFPQNPDIYWQAHREEQRRVFHWIEAEAPRPRFDQVITMTVTSGGITGPVSFEVSGTKSTTSGEVSDLRIVFLGAVAPTTMTVPAGYALHDFGDFSLEEAETPSGSSQPDRLGAITGLAEASPGRAALREIRDFAIFQAGHPQCGGRRDRADRRTFVRRSDNSQGIVASGSRYGCRVRPGGHPRHQTQARALHFPLPA